MRLRWKRPLALLLMFCTLFCLASCKNNGSEEATPTPEISKDWVNPYTDLSEDMWAYPYVARLNEAGVFLSEDFFRPNEAVTQGEFAELLGNCWEGHEAPAAQSPDAPLLRAEACKTIMNYARNAKCYLWNPDSSDGPLWFKDISNVSEAYRSDVIACQLAGIVAGERFFPEDELTRAQCAVMLCQLLDHATFTPQGIDSEDFISLEVGAYDEMYLAYMDTFVHVPECDPVDLSYFDDVVFVGDSVSLRLQYYCTANGALGNATFLCSGSLSATNALRSVGSESVHPSYQGKKMLIEDGIAACGAKKAYIMLGMNNISFGIDNATTDMLALMDRILEQSPDVTLIIQAVTPMTATSRIRSNALNNEKIDEYNEAMRQICQERGWYFLDVNTQFKDENNQLVRSYCSDPDEMGIHFSNAAGDIWVNYLKTHVPAALLDA